MKRGEGHRSLLEPIGSEEAILAILPRSSERGILAFSRDPMI